MPSDGADELSFVPELCRVRPSVTSATELLELLAAGALDAGYVRPSFASALLKREENFPTGLPTATPVAIPHVEAEHVLASGLVAATLDPPLSFHEMGSNDRTVAVDLVVLLLVTDPAAQVTTLGRLIAMFQRPELGVALREVTEPAELAEVLDGWWRKTAA